MPNFHCVIDTSALLKRYRQEQGSKIIDKLFNHEDCARHVLNVTIAEVMGAFFRWRLKGQLGTSDRKLKELRQLFKRDCQKNQLVIHNIHRDNISRANHIYDISYDIPAPTYRDEQGKLCKKERISPVDVLILSVCQEIKNSYKEAFLFSADVHMAKVAEELKISTCNPEVVTQLPF